MIARPTGPIVAPFPRPSAVVETAMIELLLATAVPPSSEAERRAVADLPRPWDPAGCQGILRQDIWQWLDQVVAWVNEEHTWRPDRTIPICWTQHPHIVHDLATVACLRHQAGRSAESPTALDDWHRYALPMFLDRIVARIGDTGCPPGRHTDNPGASRASMYRNDEQRVRRQRRYLADMRGPHRLST